MQVANPAPKICYKCGSQKHTVKTFGKDICIECLEKRKTGRVGHSGMLRHEVKWEDFVKPEFIDLTLFPVPKAHPLYVMWYLDHYPGSKGIVGRQLNYLIYLNSEPIGIIGISSPPLNYKLFRIYFDVTNEKQYMNNNVFRIVRKPDDKNIGTKILKLFRNTIKIDYVSKYHDQLLGIITFVEPPRTGAMYKADNWELLGKTSGIEVKRRGHDWLTKQYIKTNNKKLIFGIKYPNKKNDK